MMPPLSHRWMERTVRSSILLQQGLLVTENDALLEIFFRAIDFPAGKQRLWSKNSADYSNANKNQ